ncbi:MAG: ATP-binding protein [Candidatus Aenigmarchaeota archaeon]|nr:ATP-binding protein [Candidatus Aenigmarchaeota archaeon]
MMHFFDRDDELNFLNRKYRSGKAELVILYGRRRIGKTELLMHFSEGKNMLYFLGRLESKSDTLRRFNNLLVEFFGDARLLTSPLLSWDGIFDYLAEKAASRLVLIFDEFPFLIERSPEIISVLQDKWDSAFKGTKLMMILSGSSVSMMEKYALSYRSPLYGRRTGQWQVDKLDVTYLKEFFPGYAMEELVFVYSFLDMIPGYLVKFSPKIGLWKNVRERILSKGEFLYEEVEILLREELRDPSNYMSIISAIAGGAATSGEIHSKTQLDKSLLSKYLFILEKLGILEKRKIITESYKSKLKARGSYALKDNFFDFWLRFVYLNKQQLERGDVDAVLDEIKKRSGEYVGRKFESFVASLVPRLNIMETTKIGRWWHKDREIDIVALDENKMKILFCECKWKDGVNAEKIASMLSEKAKYVKWHNDRRKEIYAVFAKSFRKRITKVEGKKAYCFDLKDLEKAMKL